MLICHNGNELSRCKIQSNKDATGMLLVQIRGHIKCSLAFISFVKYLSQTCCRLCWLHLHYFINSS